VALAGKRLSLFQRRCVRTASEADDGFWGDETAGVPIEHGAREIDPSFLGLVGRAGRIGPAVGHEAHGILLEEIRRHPTGAGLVCICGVIQNEAAIDVPVEYRRHRLSPRA
jgi:hypothetical protein